jgi:hypothetical protein
VGSRAKILRHANTENACSANSGKHCAVKYQRGPDTDVKGLDRPMARDRLGHCIGPARQADPCLVLAGAQASTDKQRHVIRRLLCVARSLQKSCETHGLCSALGGGGVVIPSVFNLWPL